VRGGSKEFACRPPISAFNYPFLLPPRSNIILKRATISPTLNETKIAAYFGGQRLSFHVHVSRTKRLQLNG